MKKAHPFGAALAETRRALGFRSPHAFYKARGGKRLLGLAFVNYLRLERGRSLPKGWRLERLLSALGLEPGSPEWRALVKSYLSSMVSPGVAEQIFGADDAGRAPDDAGLARDAARQAIGQRTTQLTLGQYRALAASPLAYACHVVLANTADWVESARLASTLKAAPTDVKREIKTLAAAGMAKVSGSRVRSPLAGKFVTPPAATPALASVYAALQKTRTGWVERGGRVLHSPYLILRVPRRKLGQYLPHLSDAVKISAVYGDVAPGEDSEIYLVEGRVVRLFS